MATQQAWKALQLYDYLHPRDGLESVQLLKVGTFLHTQAPNGRFDIDAKMLKSMKSNFDENVRRLDDQTIAVDYSHEAGGKAAGWINAIELRENDTELWIEVDWTPNARQALEEHEFRYISADLDFDYIDNESGKSFGPTLLGAGLTNRPHIKNMKVIFNESNLEESKKMAFDKDKDKVENPFEKKISELEDENKNLKKKLKELTDEKESKMAAENKTLEETAKALEASEKTLKEANEKIIKLEEATLVQTKEAKFSEYLREGKIVPEQKDSFMKMDLELSETFFKNAKVLNLSDQGNAGNAPGTTKTKSKEDEKEASDIVTEKALELCEKKGMEFTEACSFVLQEDKDLCEKYEAETNMVDAPAV